MILKGLMRDYNSVFDEYEKFYKEYISDREVYFRREGDVITFNILSHKFKFVSYVRYGKLAFYLYEIKTLGLTSPVAEYLHVFSFEMNGENDKKNFSFLDKTLQKVAIDALLMKMFTGLEAYIMGYGFDPKMGYS